MRTSTYKLYITSIISFLILGLIIIIGSFMLCFYYRSGDASDAVMALIGSSMGLAAILFPILLNYKQLSSVCIRDSLFISYSFLGKRLCTVNVQESVYYSFFYIRFTYSPEIRLFALSNEPFTCDQSLHYNQYMDNHKSLLKRYRRRFWGTYNNKKIIVMPYNEHTIPLLKLEKWHKND